METIVALAGRRIDALKAKTERFPERNIEAVRLAIDFELRKHRARWLVSSAAAGADLLAIKAALNLGMTPRIVLSPSVREFAGTSVEDRGLYWTKEFENVISSVPPDNIFCIPAQPAVADTFRSINERILSDAIALSVSNSSELMCFAVWDGVKRGDEDFSAHFVESAEKLGLPVINISTI
jgi:hypothetical protein